MLRPVAVLDPIPERSAPLAGSAMARFSGAYFNDAAGAASWVPADQLAKDDLRRLSGLRADLCGLALDRPRIMGIVNVTPDSFSDGGDRYAAEAAIAGACQMVAEGADILDIGGESTRPGADTVPDAEEIRRVVPVIEGLRRAGIVTPISIDTRKSAVAEAALDVGADIVNDVSALGYDTAMAPLVAQRGAPLVLMHARGEPKTMQSQTQYVNVFLEVFDFLREKAVFAREMGVHKDRLILDPGIGFAKTQDQNLEVLQGLAGLHDLGLPVLLGASRKRFIGAIGGGAVAKDRMPGSVAVALHAAMQGVHILRVHDVGATRQALSLWQASCMGKGGGDEQ